jgi:hypothetical protein
MKRLTLFIALALTTLLAQAQTKDSALNRRMAEFVQASKVLDVPGIMDYLYPRIFEIAPRHILVQEMQKTFQSEDVILKMDSIKIIGAEPITVAGPASFTRFQTYTVMQLKMVEKDSLAEDHQMQYLELFKAQFGKDNVRYNGETGFFSIRSIKFALAIKDRYSKNLWTFVNQEQNKVLKKLLPAAVVKKYKI